MFLSTPGKRTSTESAMPDALSLAMRLWDRFVLYIPNSLAPGLVPVASSCSARSFASSFSSSEIRRSEGFVGLGCLAWSWLGMAGRLEVGLGVGRP